MFPTNPWEVDETPRCGHGNTPGACADCEADRFYDEQIAREREQHLAVLMAEDRAARADAAMLGSVPR